MNYLERLSKEHFEKLSIIDQGKLARWEYLSPERKRFWMQEVLGIAKLFYNIANDAIPKAGPLEGGDTSWGKGYFEGVRSERKNLSTKFEDFYENLKEDYQDFIKENKQK